MNEVFSAIYNRLVSDMYPVKVFDHVPQDLDSSQYPFVRINPIETTNNDTDTENGFSATVTIVSFSRYRGLQEINKLTDFVYQSLHHWRIPNTANYHVGDIHEVSRQTINAPDGVTRNAIQQFALYFEPR